MIQSPENCKYSANHYWVRPTEDGVPGSYELGLTSYFAEVNTIDGSEDLELHQGHAAKGEVFLTLIREDGSEVRLVATTDMELEDVNYACDYDIHPTMSDSIYALDSEYWGDCYTSGIMIVSLSDEDYDHLFTVDQYEEILEELTA